MALFKSGNPTLTQKIFNTTVADQQQGVMTARGTMNKFGFLFLMVIGGAAFTWHLYAEGKDDTMMPIMFGGMIGAFILSIVISFKRVWAPFLAPLFALLEGLFLGALSAIINAAFITKYPGIVLHAVGLTFAVALAMFLLYNFRIIRVTERFRSILITAMSGIVLFYLITFVLSLFHVDVAFMHFDNASPLGIGISLFVVAIASLNLLVDFDTIEKGEEYGAPKYMEWYCAFGLLVTLVWLYVELLRLLSRLNSRN